MPLYDESYPGPGSPDGRAWRERCRMAGKPDPCTRLVPLTGTPEAIEAVNALLAVLHFQEEHVPVYWNGDGGALVLAWNATYAIRVGPDGSTSSGYLIDTAPGDLPGSGLDAEVAEALPGWVTGWEG
jgi:hypothetical protein